MFHENPGYCLELRFTTTKHLTNYTKQCHMGTENFVDPPTKQGPEKEIRQSLEIWVDKEDSHLLLVYSEFGSDYTTYYDGKC